MDDILTTDATNQLAALQAGRVGARELLLAALERTDQLDRHINAVVARDVDRAFAAATVIDDARARGAELGPLAGLPMTVKDVFDLEDLPANVGMKSRLGRPATDADAVARVRAAGALIWGRTNVPVRCCDFQTFNQVYGVTRNPWNLQLTPGGSSGGSAAALAAAFTALEIGADMGGSLRIPASYCGIACHRPSWGLVSQRGLGANSNLAADCDLLVVGPMARSVRDLQLLLGVLAGSSAAPTPSLQGLRIGLWLEEPGMPIDPAVYRVISRFAYQLDGEGVDVDPLNSPVQVAAMLSTYGILLLAALGGALTPATRFLFDLLRAPAKLAKACGADHVSWAHGVLGYSARHHEWLAANERRAELKNEVRKLFARYDAILAPVAPVAPFAHDHSMFHMSRRLMTSDGRRIPYLEIGDWIALPTLCDLPTTVIPVGLTFEGLPVGVQIIGPPGGDAATLAIAAALESVAGGFRPPPAFGGVSMNPKCDRSHAVRLKAARSESGDEARVRSLQRPDHVV